MHADVLQRDGERIESWSFGSSSSDHHQRRHGAVPTLS